MNIFHEHKNQINMNVSKTITTFITTVFMLFSISAFSQTKDETVKYINDLYKKTYSFTDSSGTIMKVEKVTLDGKVLEVSYSNGDSYRKELMKYKTLVISEDEPSKYLIKGSDNGKNIFAWISSEEDAKRLKNALEHLIKIVQDEPETDPFAPK
ncbi:hypothetical protein HMPREF2660_00835 [Weeksella sp. HMSC059D05]|nr:hypothetical protein HMPREF2660_00835 [Weeksella sp. HMSC059D05]